MRKLLKKLSLLIRLLKANNNILENALFFVEIQENHSMQIEVIDNKTTRFTFRNWIK